MNNIKHLFRSLLLCLVTMSSQFVFAQQTGSFNRTVNFGGNPSWTLSYFVPTSYNAANKYKLIIGLHGLGDTPQNYRTYLAGVSTTASSPVYNSIIVAPYAGGDANTDFWTPVSDTGIITKAIADAMSAYNIDPDYIYLNGFSLGGRSALRYGLLNYWRFRGLELWTPAIQTVNEANNLTAFKYVWEKGKYVPICMTVGSTDGYRNIIPVAYQHLLDSGAIASLTIVDGLGHSPPANSYKFACFDYLNTNATSNTLNDAKAFSIGTPFDEECSTSFTPVVTIQNKGTNNLTSAVLNYQIDNGTVNTYNWSGNLIQLGKSNITLPVQSVSVGPHMFKVYTTMPNGVSDAVPGNDTVMESFNSLTNGAFSLSEGFEGSKFPPTGWRQAGSNIFWEWVKKNGSGLGGFGQSATSIRFDNYSPNVTGKKYSIRTPQCDFTSPSNPVLTYDYAYSGSSVYHDTLAVYSSTDCGITWNLLLKKGGVALNTATTGTAVVVFVPTASQWKKETINLAGLAGQSRVMFSFENISAFGNMMYLDNINVTGLTAIENETEENSSLGIYPNPNNGQFNIVALDLDQDNYSMEIRNVLGQVIYSEQLNELSGELTKQLDLSSFGKGLYFLSLKSPNSGIVRKVVVH